MARIADTTVACRKAVRACARAPLGMGLSQGAIPHQQRNGQGSARAAAVFSQVRLP